MTEPTAAVRPDLRPRPDRDLTSRHRRPLWLDAAFTVALVLDAAFTVRLLVRRVRASRRAGDVDR